MKPNQVKLEVTLTFANPIKDVQSIADQARNGLAAWTNSEAGLSGTNDTFTQDIEVKATGTAGKATVKGFPA